MIDLQLHWRKKERDDSKPFPVKGYNLTKLLKKVRELEKDGYEHVRPYQKIYKQRKDFDYDMGRNFSKGGFKFNGYIDTVQYLFVMRKKAE
ncbi:MULTISPECIES: hypothetical protein [unclassified Bacillus (in: firmicutes)]|uniref:hypothetical protein n=1 Tax=unclassified Bacillus (in: firmicutes) TaxID=185979 RepID=UPI001CEF69EB|nr:MULTISPECIES: hypothetical protein [unclassified Bacillus (in: firmicutes)]